MIRFEGWIVALSTLGLLWYECREDLGVFCYRITCGAVAAVRTRALQLATVQDFTRLFAENKIACSNPSSTFCALSTTPKDSKS